MELDWVEIPAGDCILGADYDALSRIIGERHPIHNYFELALLDDYIHALRQDYLKTGVNRAVSPTDRRVNRLLMEYNDYFSLRGSLTLFPPQRRHYLKTFYITRFPIIVEQMDAFFQHRTDLMEKRVTERSFARQAQGAPNFPEEVAYDVALAFAEWVDARLPTVEEWEKAARGPDGWLYPWGNDWDVTRGNFVDQHHAPGRPEQAYPNTFKTPVDQYANGVSAYGLWDMAGNVREWTGTIVRRPDNVDQIVVKSNMVLSDIPSSIRSLQNLFPGFGLPEVSLGKGSPKPENNWFYNLMAFQQFMTSDEYPLYTGFRLVKDRWDKQVWQGFRVLTKEESMTTPLELNPVEQPELIPLPDDLAERETTLEKGLEAFARKSLENVNWRIVKSSHEGEPTVFVIDARPYLRVACVVDRKTLDFDLRVTLVGRGNRPSPYNQNTQIETQVQPTAEMLEEMLTRFKTIYAGYFAK